jgi:hypothetical protein
LREKVELDNLPTLDEVIREALDLARVLIENDDGSSVV